MVVVGRGATDGKVDADGADGAVKIGAGAVRTGGRLEGGAGGLDTVSVRRLAGRVALGKNALFFSASVSLLIMAFLRFLIGCSFGAQAHQHSAVSASPIVSLFTRKCAITRFSP